MRQRTLPGLVGTLGVFSVGIWMSVSAVAQTPFAENFDAVVAPALPPGWSASNGIGGNGLAWSTSAAAPAPVSRPNAAVIDDQAGISDKLLDSPLLTVAAMPASLSFQRYTDTQFGFDGMRLEVSVNGGSFRYVPYDDFSAGAYDRVIELNSGSPIAGPPAWTGDSGGYVTTTYNLPASVVPGNSVRFRWRMATDASIAGGGARIDNVVGANLTVSSAPPLPSAEIAVTLTPGASPVVAGTPLSYVATATNNGPAAVPSLLISSQITGTLIAVTPSAGGSCNRANCSWNTETAAGARRSISYVVMVPANAAASGSIFASALAVSGVFDPYLDNNMVRLSTPVVAAADVAITLDASPDPVLAGTMLNYVATVANGGPSDATGVVVTLVLPTVAPLTAATVSAGGSCSGVPLVCVLSDPIAPGATRTISVAAAVEPTLPADRTIQTSASLTASSPDPNSANNNVATATLVHTADVLSLALQGPTAAVAAHAPATVTAVSRNIGASALQNLQTTIALGPDFAFASLLSSPGASCRTPLVGSAGVVVCLWPGATAPGASRALALAGIVGAGAIRLQASTTSSTADPVPQNNVASLTLTTAGAAGAATAIPALDAYGLSLTALLLATLGIAAIWRRR